MNIYLMNDIVEAAMNQAPCETIVDSELQNCHGELYWSAKQMNKIVGCLLDGDIPENLKNCGTFGAPIKQYVQLSISGNADQISSNGNILRYLQ